MDSDEQVFGDKPVFEYDNEVFGDKQEFGFHSESSDASTQPPSPAESRLSGSTYGSESDFEHVLEYDNEVVTIFDWDDTLCPSHHIRSVVEPCLDSEGSLSPDSPFYEPLHQHAKLVEEALQAARAHGRVAIVTLAKRGWVLKSASRFLPGLDLQRLIEMLDIPIYYATEHVRAPVARLARKPEFAHEMMQEGIDVQKWCKRAAMEKCLRHICRKRQVRLNVISVGDSEAEREAIKEVMWSPARVGLPDSGHLCKTLKLAEEPTLTELGCQLSAFTTWLPSVVELQSDYDMDLASEGGCI